MIKTQIVIYLKWLTIIGGVETFIYNWCNLMKDTYDITAVIGDKVSYEQISKLRKIVRTASYKDDIECDTCIVLRLDDVIPNNIKYKKKIQMIHGCKDLLLPNKKIDIKADHIVAVSDYCKSTYEGLNNVSVIHNPTIKYKPNKILKLISATRLTKEKGYERMKILAKTLKLNNIPYIWYVFTNRYIDDDGLFTRMNPVDNIKDYIKECDYLVQLSDSESYCYSVVESLELGVPVIVTPIKVYDELGIIEDKHRITLNYDMSNLDVEKIYTSKFNFIYKQNNDLIRTQWKALLGDVKPFVKYTYEGENFMKIKMIKNGVTLVKEGNLKPNKGDIVEVTEERAKVICNAGYAVVVEETKKEVKKAEVKEEVVEEAVPEKEVEVAKVKKVATRRKK